MISEKSKRNREVKDRSREKSVFLPHKSKQVGYKFGHNGARFLQLSCKVKWPFNK
jgi:hypothetical protein